MTKNQIDYWNMQRQKRADAEQARANRAKELENIRSNLANEAIQRDRVRNDLTVAQGNQSIERTKVAEQQRSNISREIETRRSNQASEMTRNREAMTNLMAVNESRRSHMANENIGLTNALANTLTAYDRQRQTSNTYGLGLLSNKLGMANLSEQRRINTANISISKDRNRLLQMQNLTNQKRLEVERAYNMDRLALSTAELTERQRHNEVSEYINAFGTALNAGIRLGGKR